jgi:putative phosphotransacetylase
MQMDGEQHIIEIVRQYLKASEQGENAVPTPPCSVVTGVSNRHVHLCREDLDTLFGEGYELRVMKELSQPGFFAAQETLLVGGPKGALLGVRILGPLRRTTQVEISLSDGRHLGIVPPVRHSGMVAPSPALTLIGPKGTVINDTGVIAAWRHIHMNEGDAQKFNLRDGDLVRVRTSGNRAVIFENVAIRLAKDMENVFHIDTDEGNAADIRTGDMVEILF